MKRIKQKGQDNRGFTLIELIVAIAVIAVLSVPLLNSFSFSARVNRNSAQLQNAENAAQELLEVTRAVSSKDVFSTVLNSMDSDGIYTYTVPVSVPAGVDESEYLGGTYLVDMKGENGEEFDIELVLTHKDGAGYKAADFLDIYDGTNNIFRELYAYDDSVVSTFVYGELNNDPTDYLTHTISEDGSEWDCVAADTTLLTYGDLMLINESVDANIVSDIAKPNIEKKVTITLGINASGEYEAVFQTEYTYNFIIEGVVPCEEIPAEDEEADDEDAEEEEATSKVYEGTIVYMPEPEELVLGTDEDGKILPLYILYAEADALIDFKEINYTITNNIGTDNFVDSKLDVYVVRQGDDKDDVFNRYNFSINGMGLQVHTNEEASIFNGFAVNPDAANKTISYTNIKTVYDMYYVNIKVTDKYGDTLVTINPMD